MPTTQQEPEMDQTTVTLNQGQQDAAEGFFKFLLGPDKEMGITGPGGVGKTFLLGYMIDKIMPQYFETCKLMGVDPDFESVQMTSTTNKAAEVLSLDCGRPTSTVQSFLNLKVHDDYATGKIRLCTAPSMRAHRTAKLSMWATIAKWLQSLKPSARCSARTSHSTI